ncbi:hypothetical protein [Mycetocola saprophilus]|uniref:hypothetical protein n=1 Tax=Mycetocola saprophilus TaxID=76636 RepID=UPI003BF323A9
MTTNVGGTLVRTPLSWETHFTQIPNAYVRDRRLSHKARGILAELMSHTTGTEVSIKALSEGTPDGLAAIRSGVTELEHHGYLRRESVRGTRGTYGTKWILTEPTIPLFEAQNHTAYENRTRSVDNPESAFENRTNTAFENRTQLRTLFKNTYKDSQSNHSTPGENNADGSADAYRAAIASNQCLTLGHTRRGGADRSHCARCGIELVAISRDALASTTGQ